MILEYNYLNEDMEVVMDKIMIPFLVMLVTFIILSQYTIIKDNQIYIKKQKEYITKLQKDLKETTQQLKNAEELIESFHLQSFNKKKFITVTVSSYNPVPKQGWGSGLVGYNGKLVTPGIIAVSHDLRKKYGLKMGKRIILGRYGPFIVGDLMNKRFSKRVDIISFIPAWSRKFGIQTAKLYYAA
jgi:uncharacterized protein YxeA